MIFRYIFCSEKWRLVYQSKVSPFCIRALVQKQKLNLIYWLSYFGHNGNYKSVNKWGACKDTRGKKVFAPHVSRGMLKPLRQCWKYPKLAEVVTVLNDLGPVMVSIQQVKAGIWWEKQFLNQSLILLRILGCCFKTT